MQISYIKQRLYWKHEQFIYYRLAAVSCIEVIDDKMDNLPAAGLWLVILSCAMQWAEYGTSVYVEGGFITVMPMFTLCIISLSWDLLLFALRVHLCFDYIEVLCILLFADWDISYWRSRNVPYMKQLDKQLSRFIMFNGSSNCPQTAEHFYGYLNSKQNENIFAKF